MNDAYLKTARTLVQIAPCIFKNELFALKGGTAINLFVREMPRLSVDIDVVYVARDHSREEALRQISVTLDAAGAELKKIGFRVIPGGSDGGQTKLHITRDKVTVKVEVNYVMRGVLRPVQRMVLSRAAQEHLRAEIELPVLAVEELYGSKLVAAMDRQHPRDLFDVMHLQQNGGITPDIIESFVAYLAGHNRPIHEVLFGRTHDISMEYERNFSGMTVEPVALDNLREMQESLFKTVPQMLSGRQRKFLVSLVRTEPDWELVDASIETLPAVQYKLRNLKKLRDSNPAKFEDQEKQLEAGFRALKNGTHPS